MKTSKGIGKSRNARLNQALKMTAELKLLLETFSGTPHHDANINAEFWETGRELVASIAQCFYEANAYNNCMVPDGENFDRDNFKVK